MKEVYRRLDDTKPHSMQEVPVDENIAYDFYIDKSAPRHILIFKPNVTVNSIPNYGALRNISQPVDMKSSTLLHPFLNLNILSDHLVHSLQDIHAFWFRMFLSDWQDKHNNSGSNNPQINLELIGRVSCKGKPHLGIEPFMIYSNQNVPRGRKETTNNMKFDHVFSFLEVKFEDILAEEIIIVKVLGIIRITNTLTNEETIKLVVLRMISQERNKINSRSYLEQSQDLIIKYSYSEAQEGRFGGMDIDIIGLNAIVRPACVIPIFTKLFEPNHKETYNERTTLIARSRRFSLVPIHKIIAFKISNWSVTNDHDTNDNNSISGSNRPSQINLTDRNDNNSISSSSNRPSRSQINLTDNRIGNLSLYPNKQDSIYVNDLASFTVNYDSDESKDSTLLEYIIDRDA